MHLKKFQPDTAAYQCLKVKAVNKEILFFIDCGKNVVSLVWQGVADLTEIHDFIKSLNFPKSYK